jgi:GT2 family glycosyltransferase
MRNPDVSIIIVTYNSQQTILDCINSILKTVKQNKYEIIISDNSSDDLTYDKIFSILQTNNNLIYIKNKENVGFSKGNNVGIKKSTGDYVLFLNPDTKVYDKTIDGMIDFMKENPDCGASTCFVELPDGKLDDSSHRGFPTPWNSFSHFSYLSKMFKKSKIFGGYNLTYLDTSKIHEIDALAGSFMLVPRNVGEKLSWWDEDYFFYGEDIDFCYRIKKAGYKIYFVPKFRALHLKGISSGIKRVSKEKTRASEETRKLATFHRFHAMEIFYDKHYKDKYPKVVNFLVLNGINFRKKIAEFNL